ncbi:unnamed protein product, partial [Rotaria magnacalcarata]
LDHLAKIYPSILAINDKEIGHHHHRAIFNLYFKRQNEP